MCKLFKLKNLNTLWYLNICSPVEILLELLGLGHFISPFQSQQWAMRVHIHPSGSPADLWVEKPISIAMLACELVEQMMSYLLHRSAGPKQQGHAPLPTTQLHQPPVYLSISIGWTYLLHCCFPRLFFQFYSWPDVLANPAWPWNFLRMNSKRTKCSQLWAERVKISLASLSGSGGTGAQCMFTRLWVLRDSLNCWRQRHCYSASALTQHQLNCSVTLIKIWYQVSADSEAAIKLLEYTGNASFQCPPLSMDVTPNYTLPHFLCLFWSSQSRLAVKRDWGRSSLKGKCIVCNCKDFSGSLQWNW